VLRTTLLQAQQVTQPDTGEGARVPSRYGRPRRVAGPVVRRPVARQLEDGLGHRRDVVFVDKSPADVAADDLPNAGVLVGHHREAGSHGLEDRERLAFRVTVGCGYRVVQQDARAPQHLQRAVVGETAVDAHLVMAMAIDRCRCRVAALPELRR
jgi:hypothetical protein